MEGEESYSDDDDFVSTQRKRPKLVEKKKRVKVVKAGPSTSASAATKPATIETPAPAPPKHLKVETTRAEGCAEGELNPRGMEDHDKRKSVTPTSTAREDQDFQPVSWEFVPRVEEMKVDEEEKRPIRDGRGIFVRNGELAEEFQIKTTDEGVDKIRKTILRLVGLAPDAAISPDLPLFEASPEPTFTPEEQGLTAGQREALFKEIFGRCGRVEVDDKPGWFLIIHKAPTTGIIHLCLENLRKNANATVYSAYRLCTEPKCYQYSNTLANEVLPKCPMHQPEPIYTVMKVTDYKRRDVLVQLHLRMTHSVGLNASEQKKDEETELLLCSRSYGSQAWIEYSESRISTLATKGLKGKANKDEDDKNRPIPKSISRYHFANEEEALKKLSFESTIGMFMKLAPGTQPIINLDDLIPLCYGMESEIDARLKEWGMELKIRRHLTPEERVEVKYPFQGEYFLTTTVITTPTRTTCITTATAAAALQLPAKGKTFLLRLQTLPVTYSPTVMILMMIRRRRRTSRQRRLKLK
ncbi:uncharacterized protein LOC118436243 isoform X2 [Folsomia candida]|uniref:uncharacterized protein LOC118436243 isoform X2 n=1 Tax=Folsomia candida TaxID=158441 RepID=UPI0016051EB1|nr:uncharacterized protein LOC118436243 isoform X2 [Folsomia candida]